MKTNDPNVPKHIIESNGWQLHCTKCKMTGPPLKAGDTVQVHPRTKEFICPYCRSFDNHCVSLSLKDVSKVTVTGAMDWQTDSIAWQKAWDEKMKQHNQDFKKAFKHDPVNHPLHYTYGKYEVFDVLTDWFPKSPLLWQVVKYLARCEHKGNVLQDLEKAQWYLAREIERRKKDGGQKDDLPCVGAEK